MIPKHVWQCFKTKDLNPVLKSHIERLKKMNPEWIFHLYDDEDIRSFIKEYYDKDMLNTFNMITSGAGKADLWRYLVLYQFGGLYLDLDSEIITPLDQWIKETDRCILSQEGCTQPPELCPYPGVNRCMVQWALIYEPKHPFMKATIDQVVNNIKNKINIHNLLICTGPVVYTNCIYTTIMNSIKQSIKIPFVKTNGWDYDGHLKFQNDQVKENMYSKGEYWRHQQNHISSNDF